MVMVRKLLAGMLLALLCGGAGAGGTGVVRGAHAAHGARATHGVVRADEEPAPRLHVGLIVSDVRNPFFMRIARTVESSLAAVPSSRPARLTVVSSGFDDARQAALFDALIRQRASLIIVTPVDPERIGVQIAAAHEAGIKVVALDAQARGADLTVVTNNFLAGRLACAHLGRQLAGRGEVAIILGPPNSAGIDRVQGCREAFAGFASLRLVSEVLDGGGSKEGGLEQMTRLLANFPRLAGVFTINDPTALGAEVAARTVGRNEVVITTVDGSPEVASRLRDERSLIAATAAQTPGQMGRRAVAQGLAMVRGYAPADSLVQLTPVLVTRENVGSYEEW